MDTLQIILPVVGAVIVAAIPAIFNYLGLKKQLKIEASKREEQSERTKSEILDEIKKQNEIEDESLRCLLRTELLKIYFKHTARNDKQLP